MALQIQTPGIHHIALRCKNFTVTKEFYQNVLGLPLILEAAELIAFMAGSVIIVFKKANVETESSSIFTPFNIGLDHIALTCESEEELYRFSTCLAEAGVENTGVKKDEILQKLYVAFKDPDRIQWEFYMK